MIRLHHVCFQVSGSMIPKDINLALEEGKVYGILGPNGAGKTTLFKALLKTIDYKGEILTDVDHMSIGKLIESPVFYPHLTCAENLQLHASYLGVAYSDSSINEMLVVVGIPEAKHKKFKALSMGMKQRLGVAKALIGNPDLLLLDEPTNVLDPMGMKDMRNLIEQDIKTESRTILIASHHLNEVALVTDTFLFMRNGEIILEIDNREDVYIYGRVQHLPDNSHVKKEITLLESKEKDKYFLLSEVAFNHLMTDREFVYEEAEKLTLEDLYIRLMSSDLMEVKQHA